MDDERIVQALQATPPDEPAYISVGTRPWTAPTDLRARQGMRSRVRAVRSAFRAASVGLVALVIVIAVGPRIIESASSPTTLYQMYKGGPGRTGEASGAGPTTPTIGWAVETEPLLDSSPVVADGVAVVVDGRDDLRALDLRTGEVRWAVGDETLVGSPAIAGSRVVVVTKSGGLIAYELGDGSLAWRTDARIKANSSPLVMDGLIFAAGVDLAVHAFDADTGSIAWSAPIGSGLDRSLAGAGGRVFVGGGGNFKALDANSGATLWTLATEPTSFATPAVRDGVVYANGGVGSSSVLFAIDAATGVERWQFSPPDGVRLRTPSVDRDRVYATSSDRVYALDRRDGTLRWVRDHPRLTRAAIGIAGSTLYVFDQSDLIALAAEGGAELWRVRVGGIVDSGTTVVGGLVLAGTSAGRILAVGTPSD